MGAVAVYALAALVSSLCVVVVSLPPQPSETATVQSYFQRKLVPDDRAYVYRYSVVVSTGQNEPVPFVSKLQLRGKLIFSYEKDSASLASRMKLENVTHTTYNGPSNDQSQIKYQPLDEFAEEFETAFYVLYEDSHKVLSSKIVDRNETHKNMKNSLASIMQMDFGRVQLHEGMAPVTFHTSEDNLQGSCQVDYSLRIELRAGKKFAIVRKTFEPSKCSRFSTNERYSAAVTDSYDEYCHAPIPETLVTATERTYEFEFIDKHTFSLRKVVSHEKFSYHPWSQKNTEVKYIETNQTFEFEKATDLTTYNPSNTKISKLDTTETLFQMYGSFNNLKKGHESLFHEMTPEDSKDQIKNYLRMMATEYLSPFDEGKEQIKLIGSISKALTLLDSDALEDIYSQFNTKSSKGVTMRKIFLEMVPQTGTHAAWNFTFNLIVSRQGEEVESSLRMLASLPLNVLNPEESFAQDMKRFIKNSEKFGSPRLQRAAILTYSILLHKTYEHVREGDDLPEHLLEEIEYFSDNVKYQNTYSGKIVHMMALRNIGVGGIRKRLSWAVLGEEPQIAKGEAPYVSIDIPKPEKFQMAAMWAVSKSISHDRQLTYRMFWPIFANKSLSVELRLTAYELLVPRNPMLDMNLLMSVHWLMSGDDNQHIFNYHYTTLTSLAETTDPCMNKVAEMSRKALQLTENRKFLSSSLSRAGAYDFHDKRGHGMSLKYGMIRDEDRGFPNVGYFEAISVFSGKRKLAKGYYWNVDGLDLESITTTIQSTKADPSNLGFQPELFGIPDEKIRNLLRRTRCYQSLKKHIHIELWEMNNGFVTQVQVYFKDTFRNLLEEYIDEIGNVIEEQEIKFEIASYDYSNHYRMIVPTDSGIPAIFHNKSPNLMYLKFKANLTVDTVITMKLESNLRWHNLRSYEMKVYNPFADVCHSVQRNARTQAALPIDLTASLNLKTQVVRVFLPRVSVNRYSVAGFKVWAGDQVVILGNNSNSLSIYCPACENRVDVKSSTFSREDVKHSLDTGLDYVTSFYDCNDIGMGSDRDEWLRVFDRGFDYNIRHQDFGPIAVSWIIHAYINYNNAPYMGTCGKTLKVVPSKVYPSSHIEMYWQFTKEKDLLSDSVYWNIQGVIQNIGVSTNTTMRSWNFQANIHFGQFVSHAKFLLSRNTTGENNLNICFDARKTYPDYIKKSSTMKHETFTKLKISMRYADDENCDLDGMKVTITGKGELLEEQVELMKSRAQQNSCFKNNSLNPLDLNTTQRFDWNCLAAVIDGTALRKYTFNVTYEKVPHEALANLAEIEFLYRLSNLMDITYHSNHTEPGNIKVLVTYPLDSNYENITVINPSFTYSDLHTIDPKDLNLDSTGFSQGFIDDYQDGDIRPCIAHSNDVITDSNQTIPMNFKDWTLMSGDYMSMHYAVFVKALGEGKLAVKIYATHHTLEVQPGDSKLTVIADDEKIHNYETEIPQWMRHLIFKVRMVNQLLIIEVGDTYTLKVFYTPYNVVVLPPSTIITRTIDGICGHMGSTNYIHQKPLTYVN